MRTFTITEGTASGNAHRKAILVAAMSATLMGLFAGCDQPPTPIPREPHKASMGAYSEIQELSEEIKQLVQEIEYSDGVAQDFLNMVISWKDTKGSPILVDWKKQFEQAKQDYQESRLSKAEWVEQEQNVTRQLSLRIRRVIEPNENFFDLGDVVKHKKADCLGYSQILYVLGNSLGLSVEAINVTELIEPDISVGIVGHVACLVLLRDDKKVMVDLNVEPTPMISAAFELEREFAKAGNYLELKKKDNPLEINRGFRILDKNGLIACIYVNRGMHFNRQGQHTEAISSLSKAIKLDPKFALAYSNRGAVYGGNLGERGKELYDLDKAIQLAPRWAVLYYNRGTAYAGAGQLHKAICDLDTAIQLKPKYAEAYGQRGVVYHMLGESYKGISESTKAIEFARDDTTLAWAHFFRGKIHSDLGEPRKAVFDYTKAIMANPEFPDAYINRGIVFDELGHHTKAISDYTTAIKLAPNYVIPYGNRGSSYALLGQYDRAIADFTKAIELEPNHAKAYGNRGYAYAYLGKLEEAKKDLIKAVELNPALKPLVKQMSDQFKLNLKLD